MIDERKESSKWRMLMMVSISRHAAMCMLLGLVLCVSPASAQIGTSSSDGYKNAHRLGGSTSLRQRNFGNRRRRARGTQWTAIH